MKLENIRLSGNAREFADQCESMNSCEDLIEGLLETKTDSNDRDEWELSATEYRRALAVALVNKIATLKEDLKEDLNLHK